MTTNKESEKESLVRRDGRDRSEEDDEDFSVDPRIVAVCSSVAMMVRTAKTSRLVTLAILAGQQVDWTDVILGQLAEYIMLMSPAIVFYLWAHAMKRKSYRTKMEEDVDDNEEMKGVV